MIDNRMILGAALFIAFAGLFAFVFFKVGALWLKASKDALEEDAETCGRNAEAEGENEAGETGPRRPAA